MTSNPTTVSFRFMSFQTFLSIFMVVSDRMILQSWAHTTPGVRDASSCVRKHFSLSLSRAASPLWLRRVLLWGGSGFITGCNIFPYLEAQLR